MNKLNEKRIALLSITFFIILSVTSNQWYVSGSVIETISYFAGRLFVVIPLSILIEYLLTKNNK